MRRISHEQMVIGLGLATAVLVAAGVVAWMGTRRRFPALRSRAVALLPSWGERDYAETDDAYTDGLRDAESSDGDSSEADREEQDTGEADGKDAAAKNSDASSFTNGHADEPEAGPKAEPSRTS